MDYCLSGIGAIECIWIDLKKPRIKNRKYWILEKIIRIVLIWLIIYIVIAVPLWCQYGKRVSIVTNSNF